MGCSCFSMGHLMHGLDLTCECLGLYLDTYIGFTNIRKTFKAHLLAQYWIPRNSKHLPIEGAKVEGEDPQVDISLLEENDYLDMILGHHNLGKRGSHLHLHLVSMTHQPSEFLYQNWLSMNSMEFRSSKRMGTWNLMGCTSIELLLTYMFISVKTMIFRNINNKK